MVSDKVLRNGTMSSAVDRKKTYFVGDFLPIMSGTRSVKRALDKLRVEAGDKVLVEYVDEKSV